MDKQWDNYFALTEDAAAVTKEVWITTPGGERPLPLGFASSPRLPAFDAPTTDWLLLLQARASLIAGACLAMGLRCAGGDA